MSDPGWAEVSTYRLLLSPPSSADAPGIFERYAGDADVTRYLGWPRHRSVADSEAFVRFSTEQWRQWPAGPYLIRRRDTGQLIGGTGLQFEASNRAMTGYVLAKDAWDRGYATEALAAMVDVARRAGVAHLYAFCHPDHRPSWQVLKKCGFIQDADWSGSMEFPNLVPGLLQPVLRFERESETRTYLEMTSPADLRPASEPRESVVITRQDPPDPELNRDLYVSVGKAWQWTDRLLWSRDRWAEYVSAPNIETWTLRVAGDVAGYFELVFADDGSVEIAYFGLEPAYIGRGLGGCLLTAAVRRAWAGAARRVWLHTSTRDHPKALANYLARGFRIVRTESR